LYNKPRTKSEIDELETQDESLFIEKNQRTTHHQSDTRIRDNPTRPETDLPDNLCDENRGQISPDGYRRQHIEKTNVSHTFCLSYGQVFLTRSESAVYREFQCSVYPDVQVQIPRKTDRKRFQDDSGIANDPTSVVV
jgi:hypothetical protein